MVMKLVDSVWLGEASNAGDDGYWQSQGFGLGENCDEEEETSS